jgi:hypothetical protein
MPRRLPRPLPRPTNQTELTAYTNLRTLPCQRVRVAVRVDTDDVVQLICEHPITDLQPKRWGTRTGVGLGCTPRAAQL